MEKLLIECKKHMGASTQGQWKVKPTRCTNYSLLIGGGETFSTTADFSIQLENNNAYAIAHAHNAMPKLIKIIEEKEKELRQKCERDNQKIKRLEEALDKIRKIAKTKPNTVADNVILDIIEALKERNTNV